MNKLPPLPKVRDLGGDEFEKLMNQLLFAYADKHRFEYERYGSKGGDGGIDGLARRGGVPGLKGPVAFQFKWLTGNLSKGGNSTQIKESLQTAANGPEPFDHYVIVTPEDITPLQRKWLLGLPKALGLRKNLKTYHWGHERLQALFRLLPDLLAEIYPRATKAGSADASAKRLLSAYLNWLIKDCAPLKLRAIDQGAARSDRQPLGLASVYVDLELTLRLPKMRSLADHLRKPQAEMAAQRQSRSGRDESKDRRVAVLEALAAHPRLVLQGAPGSGKSTLSAYLALNLAEAAQGRKKLLGRLGKWWKAGAVLPVRIVARVRGQPAEGHPERPRPTLVGLPRSRTETAWPRLEDR